MTEAPTLDTTATTTLSTQFAELEARLIEHYGPDRREAVLRVLDHERDRFAHASVPTFVPILVERSVRALLDADSPTLRPR
ncbi:MAG TPA: hypothetical protein VFV67_01430 [Actinophytocola sp.]|uniref:three-helix bundle dimerization domain-containing protein n=1 Tax=Actinophytocola sp. TaxID=1872138 RepID=UPI002DBAFBA2|nr:hypothetical protein [Actinophytocola sp.]HEU5469285.1 hypothetical protein [Actinophytocola sp.]